MLSAAATAQTQLPPSIEFRVPKAPTVATSDSGSFVAYELHVTNLTAAPMWLRRVEVLGFGGQAIFTLADSALARATARTGPPGGTPAERTQIGPGMRTYVYVWMPVDRDHPPAVLHHRLTLQGAGRDTSMQVAEGTTISVEPR